MQKIYLHSNTFFLAVLRKVSQAYLNRLLTRSVPNRSVVIRIFHYLFQTFCFLTFLPVNSLCPTRNTI
ncbi:hypothetical protein DR79_1759 [Francisella tularensis]|nr:hypothetical protein DR79_1759 [Francisella tularensis]